jgi:glycosyltransferase involved in cell wall biosynthesis
MSANATGIAPTIGYLTKRFPRLSETFILDEILGLEAAGVPLRLWAIADPGETVVQPRVHQVASPVRYLHEAHRSSFGDYLHFLRSHATVVRRHPWRWLATAGHMALSRRHLSTLKHFLEAGPLAVELEADGARHVHAAFAHGPASVAHFVHLLTGMSFSFAAHAKDLYLSSPDILARKVAAASFVLTCSSSAATEMRRVVTSHPDRAVSSHAYKVVLAPHGVDTERFTPPARTDHGGGSDGRPLRILAVGRLVPKKGYPVLLEALARLQLDGTDFDCQIVGGGELRAELRELAGTLGVQDKVSFAGSLSQPEVNEQLARADVFVQASVVTENGDRDGIPNALLEAMSSGLAVVGSAVAGIPEVVTDGVTGLVVPPGDAPALAEALGALAADPGLRTRLGESARRYCVEHLSRTACIAPVAHSLMAVAGLDGPSSPKEGPVRVPVGVE